MKNKKTGVVHHNTPAQLANLKTFGKIDPELQSEWSRRGGIASGEAYRKRKGFKEAVCWLMDQPAFCTQNEAVEKLREQFPDLTNAQAMTAAVMDKAMREGDAKAYSTIRDTSGEIPSQNVSLNSAEPMTITIKTVD